MITTAIDSINTPVKTTIWIAGKGKGKARPRMCGNAYVLPKDYRDLKNRCVSQVILQCIKPVEYPCKIACYFVNFKSSDCDNLIGFYIDVLVNAGVLQNDSSKYVTGCTGQFVQTSNKKERKFCIGTVIQIEKAEISSISLDDFLKLNYCA